MFFHVLFLHLLTKNSGGKSILFIFNPYRFYFEALIVAIGDNIYGLVI